MIGTYFALRKSKRIFRLLHRYYSRKAKHLALPARESIEGHLAALRSAILAKNPAESAQKAKELEQACNRIIPKNGWDRVRDFTGGILFALIVAVLIRTTWFELYTIPTGSMRPTLKEDDYLIVSKTDYGVNVPLQEAHFYFDPDLVKRGSVVVFNGANMDIADSDTVYFYLFPGKKQFVKRLIGKPGDILYFYGGQIYGIGADGNLLADLQYVNQMEHIPFIRFDGKAETTSSSQNGLFSSVLLHQMNLPIAKLRINSIGKITGELAGQRGRPAPAHYSDFLGMKHFAMARLLTQAELEKIHPSADIEKGILYLELTHHPSVQGGSLIRDEYNRLRPGLATAASIIPLQERHLRAISNHMTTCRFSVKNGVAWRLGWNPKDLAMHLPRLPGVPDGTYEIQNGKAYRLPCPKIPILGIFTNGITQELPSNHPLYSQDPETIHKLYNLGIEFLNQYLPVSKEQRATPSRYAYFKDGDLYLLGAPAIEKGDPALVDFLSREKQKQTLSTTVNPYFPFADAGPPSIEEIRKNGIQVPEKMYLALGDNHAMSADSRQFGFVPEDNLKGGVSFLFSPPGERWGRPAQPKQSHATFPNIAVWTFFILSAAASSLYYRRKLYHAQYKKPLKF